MFEKARSGIVRSAESYIHLCNLFDRLVRRNEGFGAEQLRVARALQGLTESIPDTYTGASNEVQLLNSGIMATATHLTTSQTLLGDESQAWNEGMLEDLKRQRDRLISMREMFDRRDHFAVNSIAQLELQIEASEKKLEDLRGRREGSVKAGEIERFEQSILKVSCPRAPLSLCVISIIIVLTRYLCRTNKPSSSSASGICSSKTAFARNCSTSTKANMTSVTCTRNGAKSVSNMPNYRLTTGARSLMKLIACQVAISTRSLSLAASAHCSDDYFTRNVYDIRSRPSPSHISSHLPSFPSFSLHDLFPAFRFSFLHASSLHEMNEHILTFRWHPAHRISERTNSLHTK